ncbi:hypothetical protein TNCV_1121771 [Trichonephila clavipes]|nr:hypothetical protein TNCV_1121771 [Trichonephila clavipes]
MRDYRDLLSNYGEELIDRIPCRVSFYGKKTGFFRWAYSSPQCYITGGGKNRSNYRDALENRKKMLSTMSLPNTVCSFKNEKALNMKYALQ